MRQGLVLRAKNLLYSKLATLSSPVSILATHVGRTDARSVGRGRRAYRKNPQQRRLSCILESDHGDIHLRRPTVIPRMAPLMSGRIAPFLRGRAGGEGPFPRNREKRSPWETTAHLPKHPQEPVIDGSKDPRHGGWIDRFRTNSCTGEIRPSDLSGQARRSWEPERDKVGEGPKKKERKKERNAKKGLIVRVCLGPSG